MITTSLNPLSIVVAGVGGQGNVLMANMIGKAAINAGYDVKGTNTYGAAQRGGPVLSQIRIGKNFLSPLIGLQEADAIVALEPAEAYRNIILLKMGGTVIVNTERIYPVEVIFGYTQYPPLDNVLSPVRKIAGTFIGFNATKTAESAGSPITLNVVMLGALTGSGILPFTKDFMIGAVERGVPKRAKDMNLKAFRLGYEFASKILKKETP